jgi:hypothetical protein
MLVRPELVTAITQITEMMDRLHNYSDFTASHDASRAKAMYYRAWVQIEAFREGTAEIVPGARTNIHMWALHARLVQLCSSMDARRRNYMDTF